MGAESVHKRFWALARRQHWVVTHRQLSQLGFSEKWIRHRVAKGRLRPIYRGVYVVGRPQLAQEGRWMAAVLACGDGAVLSHDSAAAAWGIRKARPGEIHVSLPSNSRVRRPGIRAHRRRLSAEDVTREKNIPVTTPACTIVDIAPRLTERALERTINEADKLSLIDPERLHEEAVRIGRRHGARAVRRLLERATFVLTDSELEQLFLPIAHSAGLPDPLTQQRVDGVRVDFYWPQIGLVVETDGLTYHRTPAQQSHDRRRDQAHAAAGLTPLRFTHAQVKFERDHVRATLAAVLRRLEWVK